jgi:hypothetical protein
MERLERCVFAMPVTDFWQEPVRVNDAELRPDAIGHPTHNVIRQFLCCLWSVAVHDSGYTLRTGL